MSNQPHPATPHGVIRPGRAFRDGKLYEFDRSGIIVASQWPDMRAWRKTPKGAWRQIRPGMTLQKAVGIWTDPAMDVWLSQDKREEILRNEMAIWTLRMMPKEHKVQVYSRIPQIRLRLRTRSSEEVSEPQVPDTAPLDEDGAEIPGLLKSEWEIRQDRLAEIYLQPVPDTLKNLVAEFPSRHWHLLNYLSRCPGAEELLGSSPALGFALASCWAFRERRPSHPWRSVRALLRCRRTRIAEWLGFHGDPSTLRTLGKLAPDDCSIPALLILRRILPEKKMVLRHMERLNLGLLRLLEREGESYRLTPRFLMDVCSDEERMADVWARVRDLLWLEANHGENRRITLLSWNDLVSRHDRIVDRLRRPDLRIRAPYVLPRPPFPAPPLPSDGYPLRLEPLRNEEQLRTEGSVQCNCTGRLGDFVAEGKLYLYRLLQPERATVAVAPVADGGWRLSEIKAAGNREVAISTLVAVRRWVEEASLRIPQPDPF